MTVSTPQATVTSNDEREEVIANIKHVMHSLRMEQQGDTSERIGEKLSALEKNQAPLHSLHEILQEAAYELEQVEH